MAQQLFSKELENWLKGGSKKTLLSLEEVFQERSFAIIIVLLMAVPALPIPTGGVVHVFEAIVMLLTLEMIAGRQTIWLPKKWRQKELGQTMQGKFIPYLIRRIRWLEKLSRPRLKGFMLSTNFGRVAGLVVLIFTTAAFFAPPFSGLDTIPALGAVVVGLSLLLGDMLLFIVGTIIGTVGIGLIFLLGSATVNIFQRFI